MCCDITTQLTGSLAQYVQRSSLIPEKVEFLVFLGHDECVREFYSVVRLVFKFQLCTVNKFFPGEKYVFVPFRNLFLLKQNNNKQKAWRQDGVCGVHTT